MARPMPRLPPDIRIVLPATDATASPSGRDADGHTTPPQLLTMLATESRDVDGAGHNIDEFPMYLRTTILPRSRGGSVRCGPLSAVARRFRTPGAAQLVVCHTNKYAIGW